MNIYNTQQLLFSRSQKVSQVKNPELKIPEQFYTKGFVVLNDISSPEEAHKTAELFLGSINTKRLPLLKQIQDRVQLAKADAIPICTDSVETSFQALHFDMGQPLISKESQLMISAIALYHPLDTPVGDAKTRILPLRGLFSHSQWSNPKNLEKQLLSYVNKYGDGWGETNTHRLQCFARVIDALSEKPALTDYRDKTMAQWFQDEHNPEGEHRLKNEYLFYSMRGFPIDNLEEWVELKAGQMVILDNTRVAHGRIGKRSAQEIYQFMFGLEANENDIDLFRKTLVEELTY